MGHPIRWAIGHAELRHGYGRRTDGTLPQRRVVDVTGHTGSQHPRWFCCTVATRRRSGLPGKRRQNSPTGRSRKSRRNRLVSGAVACGGGRSTENTPANGLRASGSERGLAGHSRSHGRRPFEQGRPPFSRPLVPRSFARGSSCCLLTAAEPPFAGRRDFRPSLLSTSLTSCRPCRRPYRPCRRRARRPVRRRPLRLRWRGHRPR